MNAIDILRKLMRSKKISQAELAENIDGWKQSNVTGVLNNSKGNVRVANFYQMLDAMDCELVVRNKETSEEWVVKYTDYEIEQLKPKRRK